MTLRAAAEPAGVVVDVRIENDRTDAEALHEAIELPGAELDLNLAYRVTPEGLIWIANDVDLNAEAAALRAGLPATASRLVQVYLQLGQTDRARAARQAAQNWLSQQRKAHPADGRLLARYAAVSEEPKANRSASDARETELRAASRLSPGDWLVWALLGVELDSGFERLPSTPTSEQVNALWSRCLDASVCFDRAVELAPSQPLALEYRAVHASLIGPIVARLTPPGGPPAPVLDPQRDLWAAADLAPTDFHLQALAAITQLGTATVQQLSEAARQKVLTACQRLQAAGPPAVGHLGLVLFRMGEGSPRPLRAEARPQDEPTIRLSPRPLRAEALLRAHLSDPLCFQTLRYIYRATQRFDQDTALCDVRARRTGALDDRIALAGCYARMHRWSEAEKVLQGPSRTGHGPALRGAAGGDNEAQLALVAVLLRQANKLSGAGIALRAFASLHLTPAETQTYTLEHAVFLGLSGQLGPARAEASRALARVPTDTRALRLRVILGTDSGGRVKS